MNIKRHLTRQRGAALFTALILLLVITLLSLAAIHTSTLEMRMAGNAETQMTAAENAQSLIDATVAGANTLPVTGIVGSTVCIGTMPAGTTCTVNLSSSSIANGTYNSLVSAGKVWILVTELSGGGNTLPPRGTGWGAATAAANFNVQANYNRRDERQGNSQTSEGVLFFYTKTEEVRGTGS